MTMTMAMELGALRRGRQEASSDAFSLVEVVIALGIFAVGIAVVLRLFTGISDAARLTGETEAGIRAVETLLGRLRARPWEEVADWLMTAEELRRMDSTEGSEPKTDRRLFFADATADRVGQDRDPLWSGREREKYFEIALVRDENLSPISADESACVLTFTTQVRWPASRRDGLHQMVLSGSVFRER